MITTRKTTVRKSCKYTFRPNLRSLSVFCWINWFVRSSQSFRGNVAEKDVEGADDGRDAEKCADVDDEKDPNEYRNRDQIELHQNENPFTDIECVPNTEISATSKQSKDPKRTTSISGPNGNGVVKCNFCELYFVSAKKLRKHETQKHLDKLTCEYCPKIIKSNSTRRRHMKEVHNIQRTTYKCSDCGKALFLVQIHLPMPRQIMLFSFANRFQNRK